MNLDNDKHRSRSHVSEAQPNYFDMPKLLKRKSHKQYQRDHLHHYVPGNQKHPIFKALMVGCMYFCQGIFIAMPTSLPMSYKVLPNYDILSLFALTLTPFGWKFFLGIFQITQLLFVQKYTSMSYGCHKTWMVLTTALAGFLIMLLSQYTAEQDQVMATLILGSIILSLATQDVSVDTIAIKQFDHPEFSTFLQNIMIQTGMFVGGFVFIQCVIENAWIPTALGYATPVISVSQFLMLMSCLFLAPLLFIHFFYYQRMTEQQIEEHQEGNQQSLIRVFKRYRCFVKPQFRLCRQALVYLIYPHGVNYFLYGFQYELIKTYNFSREKVAIINSIGVFAMIVASYLLSKAIDWYHNKHPCPISNASKDAVRLHKISNLHRLEKYLQIFLFFLSIAAYLQIGTIAQYNQLSYLFIGIFYLGSKSMFFIDGVISGSHASISKHKAMFGTALSSVSNIGKSGALQLKVMAQLGYNKATGLSLIFTGVLCIFLDKVNEFVRNGQSQKKKSHTK